MRRRTLYVVAAVATAALLIALGIDLLLPGYHRTAANGHIRSTVVNVPRGGRVCQPAQPVPAGTGRVRFFVQELAPVTGPLDVSISAGGRVFADGRVAAARLGPGQRQVTASVGRVPRSLPDATVCIVNRGARVQILGEPTQFGTGAAQLPAVPQPSQFVLVNLDFQLAHEESWLTFAPTVADRYGLVKATFFGAWTFWLAMAALLMVALGVIWWTARAVAR